MNTKNHPENLNHIPTSHIKSGHTPTQDDIKSRHRIKPTQHKLPESGREPKVRFFPYNTLSTATVKDPSQPTTNEDTTDKKKNGTFIFFSTSTIGARQRGS